MLKVCLSGPLKSAADGAASVLLSAATIRELLRELVKQYPQMQIHLDNGIAVSVNGRSSVTTGRKRFQKVLRSFCCHAYKADRANELVNVGKYFSTG
ncbi:MAG: hypothetical protein CM1200mP41_20690 [Gammaproteobacteria bacterium]|nr:MAG: hypothetical protein CM1200mP41_20690 [Gammaproteobacteria bacterium]